MQVLRMALISLGLGLAAGLSGCSSNSALSNSERESPEKLYAMAREELDGGGLEQARQLFEKVENRATGSLLGQQAQLEQAYIYFRQQERAQSLAIVERFLKMHPTSPALDYAYYLQGLINFNDDLGIFGNWSKQDLTERDQQAAKEAYQSFKVVTDRYPDSRYAPDAQLRMDYITHSLAAYEVHVARYYYQRHAFVAAINRAQRVVKDFRGVPATEEALFILLKSYEQLGLTPLKQDTERVMRLNYPNSPYLAQGFEPSRKRWWHLW
ncbi:MAG: outer membrane protein assembly factor BamD [Leptothrix ochracea]